jgi:hypothetical protein
LRMKRSLEKSKSGFYWELVAFLLYLWLTN